MWQVTGLVGCVGAVVKVAPEVERAASRDDQDRAGTAAAREHASPCLFALRPRLALAGAIWHRTEAFYNVEDGGIPRFPVLAQRVVELERLGHASRLGNRLRLERVERPFLPRRHEARKGRRRFCVLRARRGLRLLRGRGFTGRSSGPILGFLPLLVVSSRKPVQLTLALRARCARRGQLMLALRARCARRGQLTLASQARCARPGQLRRRGA